MKAVSYTLVFAISMALMALVPGTGSTGQAQAQAPDPGCSGPSRYFPKTQHTVCGEFLAYWDAHGGLAQQGLPLSEQIVEPSEQPGAAFGQPFVVQYFERAVFELHPEQTDPQYRVLLTQLGTLQLQRKYGEAPRLAGSPGAGCRLFAATLHQVCGTFLQYWNSHGGLPQQGFPISEEFTEVSDLNGLPYTVQYFERAVFESHPENAGTPFDVLLSQLGTYRWYRAQVQGPARSDGTGSVICHSNDWTNCYLGSSVPGLRIDPIRPPSGGNAGASGYLGDTLATNASSSLSAQIVQGWFRLLSNTRVGLWRDPPGVEADTCANTLNLKQGEVLINHVSQELKVRAGSYCLLAVDTKFNIAVEPRGGMVDIGVFKGVSGVVIMDATRTPLLTLHEGEQVQAFPDGTLSEVVPLDAQTQELWNQYGHDDLSPGSPAAPSPLLLPGSLAVFVAPNRTVATAVNSPDHLIRLWHADDGALLVTLKPLTSTINALAFSPDGGLLAAGSDDGFVRFWDAKYAAPVGGFSTGAPVGAIAFSPAGTILATAATQGSKDRTVRLWLYTDGTLVGTLQGHTDWVTGLAFTPDGKTLISASLDGTARIWNVAGGTSSTVATGGPLRTVAVSPDGQSFITGGGGAKAWTLSGKSLGALSGQYTTGVAYSPDGKLIALATTNGVELYDTAGALLRSIDVPYTGAASVSFSPDSHTLAASTIGGVVQVVNVP